MRVSVVGMFVTPIKFRDDNARMRINDPLASLERLRGRRIVLIKQLFFEIEVNSGRIFTEPRSGEVNILPLFTEIEKNNCVSIYTGSDLNNIFRRKIDSETLAKRAFTPAILFLFGLRIIHSVGGE